MPPPPPLPPDSIYTSCYCEENVYLLCRTFLETPSVVELWEIFAVFISNANKTVALWSQKAARNHGSPVVWDYHVILIIRPRRKEQTIEAEKSKKQSWVYDFDTTLGLPRRWEEYFSLTFPEDLLPAYDGQFRVVGGEFFIQNFASDRSHMLKATGFTGTKGPEPTVYLSPPPSYAPICGPSAMQKGIRNNLMKKYVTMSTAADSDSQVYGVVLDRESADDFFAGN